LPPCFRIEIGNTKKMEMQTSGPRRSFVTDVVRLVSFLKPFRWQVVKALILIGGINAGAATLVFLLSRVLNHFTSHDSTGADAGRAVLVIAAIFWVIGLSRGVLMRLREPAMMRLVMDLLRWLRIRLYGKVQEMNFIYLDRLTSGQIIERATGDVTQISQFLTNVFAQVFDAVGMAVFALAFMTAMSPTLALIALAPFPIIALLYFRSVSRIRRFVKLLRDECDVMTSQLSEAIAGARVIRSFGRAEVEKARYGAVVEEIFQRVLPVLRIRAVALNGIYVLARIWTVVVLVAGGFMVIDDRLSAGDLVAFMTYIMMLLWRTQMLMELGSTTQEARAAFDRVIALLDAPPQIADGPDSRDLPPGGGEVVFENVSFAYHEAPSPEADVVERMDMTRATPGPAAVRHISLVVRPGETIALVGPTGAGKSTVVSLLPRFYDPDEGRITLDGQDLRQTRLDSLRSAIGMVFQESFLFRGTIADNIAYGRPGAVREEIEAAGRLAQVEEFVRELQRGYDTEIGERGVSLSGGQRQRIALARAILRRPRLLILDDALAAVDPATELRIRKELGRLMHGRTTFIIAHRLATVRAAHRVVVLREGRIEDVGAHEELFGRNDFYRSLCQSQLTQPAGESEGLR
jgi:ABC-type multidrug transport system fused ATPase/permease subunit